MNFDQLMSQGFTPVSVDKETRPDYYNALEQYAVAGKLNPLALLCCRLVKKQLD
ncbi:MAG: hypothetical protein SPF92_08255 [Clostridia bacterium]|nr:hypothetical protein [Clostridia bacterium]